jgi:hypothetical protein
VPNRNKKENVTFVGASHNKQKIGYSMTVFELLLISFPLLKNYNKKGIF